MANQNMYEEITADFKYWEDASDAFRQGEGSLLPLWRFTSDKARRRQVRARLPGVCGAWRGAAQRLTVSIGINGSWIAAVPARAVPPMRAPP